MRKFLTVIMVLEFIALMSLIFMLPNGNPWLLVPVMSLVIAFALTACAVSAEK